MRRDQKTALWTALLYTLSCDAALAQIGTGTGSPAGNSHPSLANLYLPHVPSNASLLTFCTTLVNCPDGSPVAPQGVIRDGYDYSGDGAGPLQFDPSSDPCPNGGDGYHGNQNAADGGCWVASWLGEVRSAQFGSSATHNADTNTPAIKKAAVTAYDIKQTLRVDGGILPIRAGTTVFEGQSIDWSGSKLQMIEDGIAVSCLHTPSDLVVGYTMCDNLYWKNLNVDMQFHNGTPYLQRAGRFLRAEGLVYNNIGKGSFVDTVPLLAHGQATNGTNVISGITEPTPAVGMEISGSCLPTGTKIGQAAANANANTLTSSAVLHFASLPAGVAATARAYRGQSYLGDVASLGATDITLSANVLAQVNNGELITFAPGSVAGSIVLTQNANCTSITQAEYSMYPRLASSAMTLLGYHGWGQPIYASIYKPGGWQSMSSGNHTLFTDLISTSYSGATITFSDTVPTSITPATQRTITAAVWWDGLVYYTTSGSSHDIAPGEQVCITGVSPTAYNICRPAARGTVGNQIVLQLATNPTASVSFGQANYHLNFAQDGTVIANLAAKSFVTAVDYTAKTVTLSNNPSGTTGHHYFFSTGGIGFQSIATGDDSAGNDLSMDGIPSFQGFATGINIYQGGPAVIESPEISINGVGFYGGGNGRGRNSPAVSTAVTVRTPYTEWNALNRAMILSADTQGYAIGGGTGEANSQDKAGFPSLSVAGTNTPVAITDEGYHNNTGAQRFTPTLACDGAAIGGTYQSQVGTYELRGNQVFINGNVKADALTSPCAGVLTISNLPIAVVDYGATQGFPIVDNTSAAVKGGTIANTTAILTIASGLGAAVTDTFSFNGNYYLRNGASGF